MVQMLRDFFHSRGFLEVETPLLADEIIPELHIEPIVVEGGTFLQASPELHMKRLLAAGADKIFQMTRSFRAGERGQLHNPEFAIVEWYRTGDEMAAGIDLLDELMQALLGTPPASAQLMQMRSSTRSAFCHTRPRWANWLPLPKSLTSRCPREWTDMIAMNG